MNITEVFVEMSVLVLAWIVKCHEDYFTNKNAFI